MRYLAVIFLFLSSLAKADPFVFEIINSAIVSDAINLGTVNNQLCSSSGLVAMNTLTDGTNNGVCISDRSGGQEKINILIPLKIELSSTENYDITFTKGSMGSDFSVVSLRNTRDQSLGGGTELLNSTILMNNQVINAELEITAIVSGPSAGSSYSNSIEIDIVPSL